MILLLGGSGYVGSAFRRYLDQCRLSYTLLRRRDCDYYQVRHLIDAIRQCDATFLINVAGYTGKPNVDACERHKAECLLGNAVLPGIVRQACDAADIPWGHVSSGCIYTGRGPAGMGFSEADVPNFSFRTNNCSFYSGTKALGEEILADCSTCYIWRLRIPFHHVDHPRNYISKLLRYDRLLDAENSLCELDEFAAACLHCHLHELPFGTYNLTNSGSITTREIVQMLQEHGRADREYRFFDSEEQFMREAALAPRSNCLLDNRKALSAGIELRPVRAALADCLERWECAPANAADVVAG